MNIEQALAYGVIELQGSGSPDIDSQYLLCFVLDCPPVYLRTWPDKILSNEQQVQFCDLVQQRLIGKPIAYITGERGFWSLDLTVNDATLIPRPDTELLVSLALEKLHSEMRVADLGTGSGAIALSLAQEKSDVQLFAMDYCPDALRVAQQNAIRHNLKNVSFWQGSWLQAVKAQSLDVVVSNPPYIEAADPHLRQGDVRFEPFTALASGDDGLDDIRLIVKQAKHCLKPLGWLLVEHGYHQAEQVQQLFSDAGFAQISSHQDFGGQDRVVMGQLAL